MLIEAVEQSLLVIFTLFICNIGLFGYGIAVDRHGTVGV